MIQTIRNAWKLPELRKKILFTVFALLIFRLGSAVPVPYINGEVLRELSNIIRGEIKDPRINPLTSVVAVEVAPDLKTAKAYISVLGDEKSQKDTLAGLVSAEGFIRSRLAKTINLRNTPQIKFILDQSIEYGIAMSKKIDELTQE